MLRSTRFALLFVIALAALPLSSRADPPAAATRTLEDYKHFRVLSIDLLGRMPTRDEVAAFERADFDEQAWIDRHLRGPAYVSRLTGVMMDLLRLEPNVNFSAAPAQLYRAEVLGPAGEKVEIFYRGGQRRAREETDGAFCLSPDETGLVIRPMAPIAGTAKKVTQAVLDQRTVLVRPWWLYRDFRGADPKERYGAGWNDPDPQYRPADPLLKDPDGKPTVAVRVCREEAQVAESGHVYASGRTRPPPKDQKLPGGRPTPAPLDRPYATQHHGDAVPCATQMGLDYAIDCGCGVGLERCIPNSGNGQNPTFFFPNHEPLGPDAPFDEVAQSALRWFPHWWSREAVRFLDDLFDEDKDFREILTGKETWVNGPLAQFYRTVQRANCCGPAETAFGMPQESEPLFDPKNVPASLEPTDVGKWQLVPDRGPHASGILTMPIFLEKYASARARGALLYNAFLCKSFVADKAQLTPSTEPNLMVRPGCSTCHATLEPLAAYFARVEPGSFVFLPPSQFPATNATCKKDRNGRLNGPCNALYDVAFADAHGATLRSAYGSPAHADAAPAGAGADIALAPEFASCAVQHVASAFLGRPTTPDDDAWLRGLTDDFVRSGFRTRALVKGIVTSDAYRRASTLSSASWRAGGGR